MQQTSKHTLTLMKTIIITVILTIIYFSWVAYQIKANELIRFDEQTIFLVQSFIHPKLTSIVKVITDFGSVKYITVLVFVLSMGLLFFKKIYLSFFVAATSSVGAAFNLFLKSLFQRERPDISQIIHAKGFSFPSGHSMGSIIFYGSVAFVIIHITRKTSLRYIGVTLMTLLILSIGISRIYLGVHFPTDIIGGYAAGGAWLLICITVFRYYEYKKTM